jgi:hypothetical protein
MCWKLSWVNAAWAEDPRKQIAITARILLINFIYDWDAIGVFL